MLACNCLFQIGHLHSNESMVASINSSKDCDGSLPISQPLGSTGSESVVSSRPTEGDDTIDIRVKFVKLEVAVPARSCFVPCSFGSVVLKFTYTFSFLCTVKVT